MKKKPERKCLGCNEMKPKDELLKVVSDKEGAVNVDKTGKLPGRGAYICKRRDCFLAAKKGRRFERSFKKSDLTDIYTKLDDIIRIMENDLSE